MSIERKGPGLGEEGAVPVWKPVVFGAMAGGMGWGIRGQYGHETGAMLAGLLVSLVLVVVLCPGRAGLGVVRAVAWGTVGVGFGGSMTYGQTVGLTHDAELVGNWMALGWGMLGLAIKGGLWIGFFGLLLGMGLGGARYRALELAGVMLGVCVLCALGIWVLNEPHDPAARTLPRIYFSDDWRWEPTAVLKPRREVWGGLLFGWVGLMLYVGAVRRDGLAWRLGGWGLLGGAVGFPLGQSLQAYHAWNLARFKVGVWAGWDPILNWWNFMETTFGATMGAVLGLGLWLNRSRIRVGEGASAAGGEGGGLPGWLEWGVLAVHTTLLGLEQFTSIGWASAVYDFGLMLGFLPVVMIAQGRWWPLMVALPVTMLPIAGKTVRHLGVGEGGTVAPAAVLMYLVVPLGLMIWAAVRMTRRVVSGGDARAVCGPLLLLSTWLYFGLNYAFFQFPWPWNPWTARTPNAMVFLVCACGLSWVGWAAWRNHARISRG